MFSMKNALALAAGVLGATVANAAPPVYTTSVTVPYDRSAPDFCGPQGCVTAAASNTAAYTVRTGIDTSYFYVDVTVDPGAKAANIPQFSNIYLGGTNFTNNLVVEVTNGTVTTTDNTSVHTPIGGSDFSFTQAPNDISFAISLAYLESNPNKLNYGSVAPGDLLRISYSQSFGYALVFGGTFNPVTRLGAQIVPPSAAAVPEPATWVAMIAGFGAVGFAMRRRQRARAGVAFA